MQKSLYQDNRLDLSKWKKNNEGDKIKELTYKIEKINNYTKYNKKI